MTERDSSPAYRALSPSARNVLGLIERQVEHKGGVAVLSFSDIEVLLGITHGTCGYALRQVRLLGFVAVERVSARPRLVNSFRLSPHWQNHRRGRGAPIGGAGTPVAIGSAAGAEAEGETTAVAGEHHAWRLAMTDRSQFTLAAARTSRLTHARSSLASRRHR